MDYYAGGSEPDLLTIADRSSAARHARRNGRGKCDRLSRNADEFQQDSIGGGDVKERIGDAGDGDVEWR